MLVIEYGQPAVLVLANLHDLVLHEETLADILSLDVDLSSHKEEQREGTSANPGVVQSHASKQKRQPRPAPGQGGAPKIHIMYPTLVEEMARFLHMHSFNAQARRRSDAASSMGVTLEQIRQHLLDCVPGLKTHGISRSTVHRLMLPPRRKTQAAKQYKGLVQARVPCKKNTATRAEHPDLHFTRAQVGYVNEMFQ